MLTLCKSIISRSNSHGQAQSPTIIQARDTTSSISCALNLIQAIFSQVRQKWNRHNCAVECRRCLKVAHRKFFYSNEPQPIGSERFMPTPMNGHDVGSPAQLDSKQLGVPLTYPSTASSIRKGMVLGHETCLNRMLMTNATAMSMTKNYVFQSVATKAGDRRLREHHPQAYGSNQSDPDPICNETQGRTPQPLQSKLQAVAHHHDSLLTQLRRSSQLSEPIMTEHHDHSATHISYSNIALPS